MPLRRKPARIALAGVTALVLLIGMVALLKGGGSDSKGNATAAATAARGIRDSEEGESFPEPASGDTTKVAEDPSQAALDAASAADSGPSPGAPSDAEVRKELRRLESWQRRARAGGAIGLGKHGLASAPAGSPTAVQDIVAGGNAIATFPYRLGGGHGSFVDSSYDCSGSVSYALAAAGLVEVPRTSGEFMDWGAPGRGRWVTVYANPGHVFMTVGGVRFDTSGRAGRRGSRWQPLDRSASGFVARHWPGL